MFEDPQRNTLQSLNQHYYTQALKYQGKDLYLASDWFYAPGLKPSIDNKTEILAVLQPSLVKAIKSIEEIVTRHGGLKLPVEYQGPTPAKDLFKFLPDRDNYYLKLQHDAPIFDRTGKPTKVDLLSMGDYRVMIHVKGLYIGHHPTGKLVSLQLRVVQVQHIPRAPECMFVAIPPPASNNAVSEVVQPVAEAAALNAPSKRGRKPQKLMRQNAVIGNNNTEIVGQDFYQENLFDLASLASSAGVQ